MEVSSHPCAHNDAAPNLRFVAVISSDIFVSTSLEVLRTIAADNRERIDDAAALLHPVIASGGIIHSFGTGHSRAAAMEMAGRAGGLIPTNQISLGDLVLRGGEGPEALDDPLLERRSDMIPRVLVSAMFASATASSSSPTPVSTRRSSRWRARLPRSGCPSSR